MIITLTDNGNSVTFQRHGKGDVTMVNSRDEIVRMPFNEAQGRVRKLIKAGWKLA